MIHSAELQSVRVEELIARVHPPIRFADAFAMRFPKTGDWFVDDVYLRRLTSFIWYLVNTAKPRQASISIFSILQATTIARRFMNERALSRVAETQQAAVVTLESNKEHQYALTTYAEELQQQLNKLDKLLVCYEYNL